MTMGKGGVGKTTVAAAAAAAVALAARGHRVVMTTTDPAAHLSGTLTADVDGITVSRIDPLA